MPSVEFSTSATSKPMGFSPASVVAKKFRAISSQDVPQRHPLTSSNSLKICLASWCKWWGIHTKLFGGIRSFRRTSLAKDIFCGYLSHGESNIVWITSRKSRSTPNWAYRAPGGTSLWGRPWYKTLRAPVSPCQRPAPKPVSCWRQNLERPLPSRRCARHLFDCKPPSVATAYWARFPAHPAEWQALHPIPQGSSCSSSHDPKECWPGSKGNMSFHFEPNFFHLRFAASMAQRKPKQLSFWQFPRKAETAFPCAWPMLDPQHTRNKKNLHWAIFISSGPQTSNKTSGCGYIKIVESSPMSFLLHTRCFLSDCQRLPWSGCTSKWNEKKNQHQTRQTKIEQWMENDKKKIQNKILKFF